MKISKEQRAKIIRLRNMGIKPKMLAVRFGVSTNTIGYILYLNKKGNHEMRVR